MNSINLEELLSDALEPAELPSDMLNAKLKKKLRNKRLYTGRRKLELSAVCAAAVVAAFAIAIKTNNDFSNKISEVPIVSNIVEKNDIISENKDVKEISYDTAKETDDNQQMLNKQRSVENENAVKSDINEKQDKKTVRNSAGVIAEQKIEEKGEFIPMPEEKVQEMQELPEQESKMRAMPDTIDNQEETDSMPMMASLMHDETAAGGGSVRNSRSMETEELIPVVISEEDIITAQGDDGKKYSVDKQNEQRITVKEIFEDGYDYSTALYIDISGQIEGTDNTFNEISGNEDFYISNSELYITFDAGEIMSEEHGVCEFNVGKIEEIN